MSIFNSKNFLETQKIAIGLSIEIQKTMTNNKKAVVLGLIGDLGGGKTTFLQGFAKGLGIKEKITSPTFVLLKRYQFDNNSKNFYHIDCYRMQSPKEMEELGWKEITENPNNIIAVEWANKILKILPENSFFLNFDFIDGKKRKIKIKKILNVKK